ncbi:MAG: esterase, partial [Candidatus Eremiobacteraeota bacterium]|nr:esterase [Candidatus Eremiobacteraeota bacterium]
MAARVNYRLFVPRERVNGAPLFVALHGCRQDAEDFAQGT